MSDKLSGVQRRKMRELSTTIILVIALFIMCGIAFVGIKDAADKYNVTMQMYKQCQEEGGVALEDYYGEFICVAAVRIDVSAPQE